MGCYCASNPYFPECAARYRGLCDDGQWLIRGAPYQDGFATVSPRARQGGKHLSLPCKYTPPLLIYLRADALTAQGCENESIVVWS